MTAIEPAVRFYEEPPAEGMTVETDWSDVWLSADDWAEAFEAPDPGTPHNEARDQIWEELLDDPRRQARRRGRLARAAPQVAAGRTGSCSRRFNRAWPLLEATDLVGDLWSVPAYLRQCAPWLSADEVRTLQRADAAGLDGLRPAAAGRRPAAARRPGGVAAPAPAGGRPLAAEREHMARVVDDLIAADDSELLADDDAARRGPPGRPGRRGRAAHAPTPTCSPARSRTSSSTRRRS